MAPRVKKYGSGVPFLPMWIGSSACDRPGCLTESCNVPST